MAKPISMNSRECAIAPVQAGESVRSLVTAPSISASSEVNWSQRFRAIGSRALVLALAVLLWFGWAPVALGQTAPSEPADATASESNWDFRVGPYIWIPAMTGDVTIKGTDAEIDTTISDIFTTSDFAIALQGQFEAWYRDRWGAFFNGQWAVLKQHDNFDSTPLEFDLKMNSGIFEFGGLYSFGEQPFGTAPDSASWTLEPLAGARVSLIKMTFDFDNFGKDKESKTFVDPFLGARATFRFGTENRWRWILRGDIGGFGVGSDFTWNAVGMLGYDFHIASAPSTVLLGARALSQDYKDGSGSNEFRWDVIQYGPLLALELKF